MEGREGATLVLDTEDPCVVPATLMTPPSERLTLAGSGVIPSRAMSEPSLDRALHAISDPTRRRILQALKEGEASAHSGCLCAGDIEAHVPLSQPTISHHMAILVKSGLVDATKKGQWRWYRRNEKAIRGLVKALRGKL